MCTLEYFMTIMQLDVFTHCPDRGRTQFVCLHMAWRHPRQAGTADSTLCWLYTGLQSSRPHWPERRPANQRVQLYFKNIQKNKRMVAHSVLVGEKGSLLEGH